MNRQFARPTSSGNLPNRLQERQAFDVADGAAQFGDHDINARASQFEYGSFDFVGDVRDDLDRFAEINTATFLLDDVQIDSPGRLVRFPRERAVGESLIVTEVEVCLGSVVEDVDLAVLVRAHRARVDVDVRVEFLQSNAQAPPLQQHAQSRLQSAPCPTS